MTSGTITWDHRTREFATALSLAVRDRPVPYAQAYDLACALVRHRDGSGTGMAMDAGPAMERAFEELQDHLRKCIRDPDDLHKAIGLANSLGNSAQRDEDLRKADAIDARGRRARDADLTRYRQPSDLERRQAEDAGPSQLDAILAGVKAPRWPAGR